MIIITVTSEIVEITRSFRKDATALSFLKKIKRLHDNTRKLKIGPRPNRKNFGKWEKRKYDQALKSWQALFKNCVPIKITIDNQ